MTFELTRRTVLTASLPWLLPGCATPLGTEIDMNATLQQLQARAGGKLGLFAHHTGTGDFVSFNAESRFAMASTFKVLLAGAVLQRVDDGVLDLGQMVPIRAQDLIAHSPVTSKAVAHGRISVRDLCACTVEVSDNAAANLLLTLLGGPAAVTDFVRGFGDMTTRLDRTEPDLNTNLPGDLRDTTTPLAMGRTLQKLLLGNRLSEAARAHLTAWMIAATTGQRRLRAGLPAAWRVGDKTGTGNNGAVNTVALTWPPGRPPIILAVYMTGSTEPMETLEAAHAVAARLVARELTRT